MTEEKKDENFRQQIRLSEKLKEGVFSSVDILIDSSYNPDTPEASSILMKSRHDFLLSRLLIQKALTRLFLLTVLIVFLFLDLSDRDTGALILKLSFVPIALLLLRREESSVEQELELIRNEVAKREGGSLEDYYISKWKRLGDKKRQGFTDFVPWYVFSLVLCATVLLQLILSA